MRHQLSILFVLFLCAQSLSLMASEKYHLVKITNMDKTDELRVFTDDEFKAFKQQARDEAKYFSKALSEVKKEWADDENREGSLPMLSKPKYRLTKTYSSREAADKKVAQNLEFKEQKKKEDLIRLKDKVNQRYTVPRGATAVMVQRVVDKRAEAMKKPELDAMEKANAAALVQAKINALMKPPAEEATE